MQIGLMGFGTIGSGVYELINSKFNDIRVKKILVRGLHGRSENLFTTDREEILNDDEIDTIVIAIGDDAVSYEIAIEALKRGKNVVSANKEIVVNHLSEFIKLANENNVKFRFESTVGAGLPWIKTLCEYGKINNISKVYGNFNGTSNFILDMMKRDGIDFKEALLKSRILRYQEPDYFDDITGVDSRNKLIISMMLAFNKFVVPKDIPTYGIQNIRSLDFGFFERHKLTPKLMSYAMIDNDKVAAIVAPTLYEQSTLRANVHGNNNMLGMVGDVIGEVQIIGAGAGKYSASNGVLLDLLEIINGDDIKLTLPERVTIDETRITHRFYFSFDQSSYKIERILLPYVHSIFETQDSFVITTRNISLDTCIDLLEKIEDTDERFFFAVYGDEEIS